MFDNRSSTSTSLNAMLAPEPLDDKDMSLNDRPLDGPAAPRSQPYCSVSTANSHNGSRGSLK